MKQVLLNQGATNRSNQNITTAPVKWLRIPAAIAYCGLSRSTLYTAMDSGELKSSVVRQKGSTKGVRLISIESLDAYIQGFVK